MPEDGRRRGKDKRKEAKKQQNRSHEICTIFFVMCIKHVVVVAVDGPQKERKRIVCTYKRKILRLDNQQKAFYGED
jgi:hypothetical protein